MVFGVVHEYLKDFWDGWIYFPDFIINCDVYFIDYFLQKDLSIEMSPPTHFQMNIMFFVSYTPNNRMNLILFHEIDYVSPVFMAIMCC